MRRQHKVPSALRRSARRALPVAVLALVFLAAALAVVASPQEPSPIPPCSSWQPTDYCCVDWYGRVGKLMKRVCVSDSGVWYEQRGCDPDTPCTY
jgi:hypothetical protein